MEDWIIRLVDWAGYWGVALLMLLETVFPPVPSEVIMTVAGVSASRGNMTLTGTIAAGTAGAMLGNWFWYWLAIKFGEARMHVFIDKYSRWLTLDWEEVERGVGGRWLFPRLAIRRYRKMARAALDASDRGDCRDLCVAACSMEA